MKKKLLSMLTLMTLCISGAWAETVVTNPATEMVDGTYITMQCMDTNGGDEYYFNGNTTKSEALSFANIYKIVSNGADAFYLQRVSDSKYVGNSSNNVTMVDETSAAAAFTFSIATATSWTTYDNTKYTNGTSTVRFTNGSNFLNTQAASATPKYAGGTGGYSIWYVKTYTQNEVDKKNPDLLTFSEVKDGYTYALVNVQPTNNVGKNYYLNSTDGNLTPVDATGINNTSEWPTTAQFVAEKQTDGTYAFKNVANGLYLAWKAHASNANSTGENSNKGFVSTVELWSAWTMNKSTREGWTETYWLSCAKRASSVTGIGTLLLANNGSWNAANTEWTTSAYSNNYGLVELAAPTAPEYTITFNFTGVAEGSLTTTVRGGNVPTLPVAVPNYVNYEVSPALAEVTGDATYTVTTSYKESMPFQVAADKYYTIKMNRNPNLNIYVDPTDNTLIKTTTTAIAVSTQEYYKWQFGGDWLNGFTLKNKATDNYVTYNSTNPNDKYTAVLTDTPNEGAYYDLVINGGKNYLKIHGTTNNAYISNNGGSGTTFLTNWNHANNIGDGGAQLIIAEAEDLTEEAVVTYTYTFNGETVGTETFNSFTGRTFPTPTNLPGGVVAQVPEGTINATSVEKTVECTLADNAPFQYSTDYSNAKWYTLTIRDTKYPAYNSESGHFANGSQPSTITKKDIFAFVGTPWNLKIINGAIGSTKALGATYGNNAKFEAVDFANGTSFKFEINSSKNVFACNENTRGHVNDVNGELGIWDDNSSATDGGSKITFAPVDQAIIDALFATYDTELVIAINNANENLDNCAGVSALYTTAAVNAARADIEAISYEPTNEESVNAAAETLQGIMNTFYASANGKKVAIKSLSTFSTRGADYYLNAQPAGTQMTSTNDLTGHGVFTLNYNADANAYTIYGLYDQVYVNKTGNASTAITTVAEEGNAGLFTVTATTNDDHRVQLYCTNGNDGNKDMVRGIHLDGYMKIVVWGATAGASEWVIEEVTDEQWIELDTPDWAVLEAAIANNKEGRIQTGLNNYAPSQAYTEALATANTMLSEKTATKAQVLEAAQALNNAVAALQINQPSDGSFIRIRSVKSGMGYVNAEASNAHDGCLAVGAKGSSSIFYYKDGKLISYTKGQYVIKNNSGSGFAALGTTGDEGAAIVFGTGTRQNGTYTVTFNDRYLYAGDNASNVDAGGSEGNNGYDFWLEDVETLPVTISEAGLATLYAPVALEIPAEVNAYTMAVNGEYLKGAEIESGIIPANTGVVLEAETAGTYNFNITTGGEGESCLNGTIASIAAPENVYTLANDSEDGLGFYKFNGNVLGGFKAYYQGSSAEVKGFKLTFGDTETGIANVNDNDNDNMIYNLAGQRVQKLQKGINIVGGKKVLY